MTTYNIVKALHIISIVAWMAGLLYLPRLFVYHSQIPAEFGCARDLRDHGKAALENNHAAGDAGELGFRRVARCRSGAWMQGWLHAKLALVLVLSGLHGFFAKEARRLAQGGAARPRDSIGSQRGADTYPGYHGGSRGAEALLRGELAVQTDRTGTGREAAGEARVMEFARCAPGKWASEERFGRP